MSTSDGYLFPWYAQSVHKLWTYIKNTTCSTQFDYLYFCIYFYPSIYEDYNSIAAL